MTMVIDGKRMAAEIQAEVAAETAALTERGGRPPGLAAVLVGEDPASQVYVRSKHKACQAAGLLSEIFRLPADCRREDLLGLVDRLNADPAWDGILVQLPLPGHLDEQEVIERIDPDKDVDGFHPVNAGRVLAGLPGAFAPATPAGIQEMLKRSGIPVAGAHVVVLGRSNIVGKPMASLLVQKAEGADATVTICHSRTRDLPAICRQADILIAAIGRARFVTADMVKEGAVVIDVGINRIEDPSAPKGSRLVGDVDFDAVAPRCAAITPVTGGVGPMTIAMLLRNTLLSAHRREQRAAGGR
ncbi:MAG: bifunctional methylenetetrahydrofolate dehydrogenase/methenyltetrahydrofolate cyclohydrolase FolD [bacterium]|nr:bifunctional methylenetetrahydrofolate dehydrogenase/methenyltetrahydrofolate cyclohydrolase FolD [bacterium]